MLLQHWNDSKPNLVLAGEPLGEADRYSCFVSFISFDGRRSSEMSSCIQKARPALTNEAPVASK